MEETEGSSGVLSHLQYSSSRRSSEMNKNFSDSSTLSDLCDSHLGLDTRPPPRETPENGSRNNISLSHSDINTFMSLTLDSKYKQSIDELSSAFDNAVDTVLLFVEEHICFLCVRNCPAGVQELKRLLSFLPPMVATTLLERVLLKASQSGKGHALVHLLAIGVNGDCTDAEKRNALHLACMAGFDNCVHVLLDFKAICRTKGRVTARSWDPKNDFEALDVHSKTPLDYAKPTSVSNLCAFYIEKAIEAKQNKRVKIKKKS